MKKKEYLMKELERLRKQQGEFTQTPHCLPALLGVKGVLWAVACTLQVQDTVLLLAHLQMSVISCGGWLCTPLAETGFEVVAALSKIREQEDVFTDGCGHMQISVKIMLR